MLNPFSFSIGRRQAVGLDPIMDECTTGVIPNATHITRPESAQMHHVPLYNSRIIDNYVKLIKKRYRHIEIGALLKYAGITSYEIADQGHWFTQHQINRFHERLSQLTGNESIAREAGRFSAAPESLGIIRQYVLGMLDPTRAYELIGKMASNMTRSSTFKSRPLAPNKVEIEVNFQEDVKEQPFQCENRIGFFESVTMSFSNRLPVIEHPECVFQGGQCCRYLISWEKTPSALIKRVRNFLVLILASVILATFTYDSHAAMTILLPFALLVFFLLSLCAETLEKNELKTTLNNLRNSTETLVDQINLNYNNSLLTNEIGLAITKKTNTSEILNEVIRIFEIRLDYDRGVILLANNSQTMLEYRVGYGYSDKLLDAIRKINFRLDNPESKGIFVVSFRKQKPYLVNNINDIEEALSPRSREFARTTGARSFICCPIISDGESIGILAVDNVSGKRPLVQSDMSLLMGIASILGVSIRNAQLLRAKERQFNSILQVMATTIDARDPMTSGHSEKVTEYALGICEELGMSSEYRRMIQVAALLHDYGKIGVPDSILKKPGKLTPLEYKIVQTHVVRSREILEQINFEGIFAEVPRVAGAHHEKIDGSGYPLGLKGDQIPLGAKIIAVADFFEAITSERHYRNPMFTHQALERLREKSGIHFDERIVAAFLTYFRKQHADEKISVAS
ncbi:MAG: HD domain-containing protein [Desulfosarcina sp.]|nr:HD domain-containing protein [Desulfobacterales bacterium]